MKIIKVHLQFIHALSCSFSVVYVMIFWPDRYNPGGTSMLWQNGIDLNVFCAHSRLYLSTSNNRNGLLLAYFSSWYLYFYPRWTPSIIIMILIFLPYQMNSKHSLDLLFGGTACERVECEWLMTHNNFPFEMPEVVCWQRARHSPGAERVCRQHFV